AHPYVVAALAQEAGVLASLPRGIPAPGLVGFDSVDGWSVLVLEVVVGRMPGQPWTQADIDAAHDTCRVVAELGTPTTLGSRDYAHRISTDPDILRVATAMSDRSFAGGRELPSWLPRHQTRVGELVLGAGGRFEGDTLSHGDLRPDNLLVEPAGRVVVVDWNWVGRAAAWLDWVGLLPMMAWQGVDTGPLVAESPLTRDVDPEAVDAFLACIAVYMVEGYPRTPPPGCTTALRRHQLLMAHMFLELLRGRRGWAT
ncbi:MAG: phosphotransferase, partial [Actinomycetota bacterium]|nr:phosphotransferase [Actinomycetota bacterium]